MIRILQWGTARSICKVYNKNEDNELELPQLLLVSNEEILNLEEVGVRVISVTYLT